MMRMGDIQDVAVGYGLVMSAFMQFTAITVVDLRSKLGVTVET